MANTVSACQERSLRRFASETPPQIAAAITTAVTGQRPVARSSDMTIVRKTGFQSTQRPPVPKGSIISAKFPILPGPVPFLPKGYPPFSCIDRSSQRRTR